MELTFYTAHNSIREPVTDQSIADFVVLSGPNGSGKSNLLDAVRAGAIGVDGFRGNASGQPQKEIRHFAIQQFQIISESIQIASSHKERWRQVEARVKELKGVYTTSPHNIEPGSDHLEGTVQHELSGGNRLTGSQIAKMRSSSGDKRLIDFSSDDFRRFTPLVHGDKDFFALSIGEVFVTYQQMQVSNKFARFCEAEDGKDYGAIEEEQFIQLYGKPPWELLNEIVAQLGFEYYFNAPEGFHADMQYEPEPILLATGEAIKVAYLSSGEKTLLALAISLYAGAHQRGSIAMPKVLLLDEADASLHPSMVQSMLRVIQGIFVEQYGVKVILTTHSPTTVALAPENSLYTMRRFGSPRLRPASRDEALSSLLVGLPTLSVKDENRRQVFVESEYDAACYQELWRLLKAKFSTSFSLTFIPSGRGDKGGGSDNVKHLVTTLRGNGNLVHGVLDRDDRQDAPDGIAYIANRYALENLILDPVIVALLLLRERKVKASEMVGNDITHFELDSDQAQAAADYVISRTRVDGDDETPVEVEYLGSEKRVGAVISVPKFVLEMNGHDWEDRLVKAFPALQSFKKQLKFNVIQRVIRDCPEWTPLDVTRLFDQLLT